MNVEAKLKSASELTNGEVILQDNVLYEILEKKAKSDNGFIFSAIPSSHTRPVYLFVKNSELVPTIPSFERY